MCESSAPPLGELATWDLLAHTPALIPCCKCSMFCPGGGGGGGGCGEWDHSLPIDFLGNNKCPSCQGGGLVSVAPYL